MEVTRSTGRYNSSEFVRVEYERAEADNWAFIDVHDKTGFRSFGDAQIAWKFKGGHINAVNTVRTI